MNQRLWNMKKVIMMRFYWCQIKKHNLEKSYCHNTMLKGLFELMHSKGFGCWNTHFPLILGKIKDDLLSTIIFQ